MCFVLFCFCHFTNGDQLLLTSVCCFLSGKSPSPRESESVPLKLDSVVQGSKQEITKLVPLSIDVRKTWRYNRCFLNTLLIGWLFWV